MSDAWDDFEQNNLASKPQPRGQSEAGREKSDRNRPVAGCDWGQGATGDEDGPNQGDIGHGGESSKFIQIYERYLQDRKSILQQTTNYKTYASNVQKELREWFENLDDSELKFKPQVEQIDASDHYVCTLDLPVDDQDFTLTSGEHNCRKDAIDEVCLDACRMLDDCGLLYAWQSAPQISQEEELARRKRVSEALKEDDIVFDSTGEQTTNKKHCKDATSSTTTAAGVNTYESLMARWRELNMSILMLKAKLVKLDLSVTKQQEPASGKANKGRECATSSSSPSDKEQSLEEKDTDDDDEPDPLDEFMSTLETKTKLSMDDKIEKSRIKSQIASYEREQSECARLIEIAKPRSSKAKGKT